LPVPLLDYSNVTVMRGNRVALDRVTFSIHAGEHVVILGPNGSGKSTLIKTITRECYPRPAEGSSLRIMGREIWNVFELRNLLGIVTNDLADTCRRDLSGRELVLSGFFSSIGIWPNHEVTAAMEEKTTRTLERLEIAHLGERSVDEMSSGEARRVLVARALVHEPSALVLDEPTNSLDFRALHEVREMMRRVAAEGTTIILVTHHLPDIIPEIERVILLNEGRVTRDGSKEELLTPSVLSKVFGVPVDLARRDGYFVLY